LDENEITINLEQLQSVLSEIENFDITVFDEKNEQKLDEINSSLQDLILLLDIDEEFTTLSSEELKERQEQAEHQDITIASIDDSLRRINTNLLEISEDNEQKEIDNKEFNDLQIKANGSLVMIFYLIIAYGLVKTVFTIFNWFGNKI